MALLAAAASASLASKTKSVPNDRQQIILFKIKMVHRASHMEKLIPTEATSIPIRTLPESAANPPKANIWSM